MVEHIGHGRWHATILGSWLADGTQMQFDSSYRAHPCSAHHDIGRDLDVSIPG
jgi:hypothetical protein